VTRDPETAYRVLLSARYDISRSGTTLVLTEPRALESPDVIATLLVNAGTPPVRLAVVQEDLEQYFLRLTGGGT
jgi:ABC-2 type transport system ATP-binding protein